jgi:hypothetical protein
MKSLLILSLIFLSQAPAVRRPNRVWHPATYRGLIIGKSKQADMLRVLGKPRWTREPKREDQDESDQEVWSNYERVGEFPGQTSVVIRKRTGVIERIEFYPARLSKEQAIAHFGPSYVVTRYAFDSCLGDEDSEALFESPNGPLVSVEYRARGIAISIGYQDLVTRIRYVDGPIGSTKSKCN